MLVLVCFKTGVPMLQNFLWLSHHRQYIICEKLCVLERSAIKMLSLHGMLLKKPETCTCFSCHSSKPGWRLHLLTRVFKEQMPHGCSISTCPTLQHWPLSHCGESLSFRVHAGLPWPEAASLSTFTSLRCGGCCAGLASVQCPQSTVCAALSFRSFTLMVGFRI